MLFNSQNITKQDSRSRKLLHLILKTTESQAFTLNIEDHDIKIMSTKTTESKAFTLNIEDHKVASVHIEYRRPQSRKLSH